MPSRYARNRVSESSQDRSDCRQDNRPIFWYWVVALLPTIALLGGLFSSCLTGDDRLAFRDASHFYTPLYGYLANRSDEQWLPLWNPNCQTGMPLLGETTTAMLYPVRWLLGCLPLASSTQIAWYVFLHLVLASVTSLVAASRASVRPFGQAVTAMVYPFSGSVFFLHTNPPFLVGAAWMPIVLSYWLCRGTASVGRRIKCVSVAAAMMVLGGDPQTLLHCVLVAVPVVIFSSVRHTAVLRRELTVIFLSCLLAAGLAAPQIAGSLSWSRQSSRIGHWDDQAERETSWFSPPAVGSRKHEAMQYSVPPWHFAELLTPHAWGTLLPQNNRHSALIAGESPMWTPTLFMGLLPVLMMANRLSRRAQRVPGINPWLTIAGAGAVLSMGTFGTAWWGHWITGGLPNIDSAALGSYWLLYHFVPGYDAFRYPAKWLPFLSLGLAVATGMWIGAGGMVRVGTRGIGAVALMLTFVLALLLIQSDVPSSSAIDDYWGPLRIGPALRLSQVSVLMSLVTLALWWMVGGRSQGFFRPDNPSRYRLVHWVVFVLLAIELGLPAASNLPMVSVADEACLMQHLARPTRQQTGANHRAIRVNGSGASGGQGVWPAAWRTNRSADRLIEVAASERSSGFGRWHLEQGMPTFNNLVTLQSRNQALFWESIKRIEQEQPIGLPQWSRLEAWLGIDINVVQTDQANECVTNDQSYILSATHFSSSPDKPPIAPSTLVAARTIDTVMIDNVVRRLGEVMSQSSAGPVLTTSDETLPVRFRVFNARLGDDRVSVSGNESTLVVRSVFQDGHWHAQIGPSQTDQTSSRASNDWRDAKVFQADFLKQAVVVPPGDWEIRFEYRPWWLWPTMMLAAAAWGGIILPLQNLNRAYQIVRQRCFVGH